MTFPRASSPAAGTPPSSPPNKQRRKMSQVVGRKGAPRFAPEKEHVHTLPRIPNAVPQVAAQPKQTAAPKKKVDPLHTSLHLSKNSISCSALPVIVI